MVKDRDHPVEQFESALGRMVRKWISFRALFDDPTEPNGRGIDLTSPDFQTIVNPDDTKEVQVSFAVEDKPKRRKIKDT